VFEFNKTSGDRTLVKLSQTGVPVGEREQVKTGWNSYYWNPMKQAFGFGAGLN
jgi:activator of HSP90 ATPase